MSFRILLYDDPGSEAFHLGEIRVFLTDLLDHPHIEMRDEFFRHHGSGGGRHLARILAGCRAKSALRQAAEPAPLWGEIDFEERALRDPSIVSSGILYAGPRLMAVCRDLLPVPERTLSCLHIVFTRRFFGDYGSPDGRFHGRAALCGFPSLISTIGIIEAPAKPREFYRERSASAALGLGIPSEILREKFRGRFLDYGDTRLTETLKGYALQVVFYHVLGDPYCEDPDCRLFNAHWQEEVLRAQTGTKPDLCESHQTKLGKLREEIRAWS